MKYESLLNVEEKNKWVELEVTLGTNEALISQELIKLQRFLKTFNDLEKASLNSLTGSNINLGNALELENNPKLLRLLLIKKFIDQHGLSVIREAKQSPGMSEKAIFLEVVDKLFNQNEYPEQLYVYAVYRQRGTPNTWLKVIANLSPNQVEQTLENKIKSLQSYINYHLHVSRHFRFKQSVDNLTIFVFSKPIAAKVIKGELKNLEAQRATYTMIVFDRSENKIGVVTGSKREVQLIQRYIRYNLLPDSIGAPRSEIEADKKEILKKLMSSNINKGVLLNSISFETTQLPDQPSLKLKARDATSLDNAINNLPHVFDNLGIDALKNLDYQINGKNINVYFYGDDWKRLYINVSAKRRSALLESQVLDDLSERLGVHVKETSFVIEPLSDELILEKILSEKRVNTFPPVPKQVEKLIIKLLNEKIIRKPTKISKRKCSNCYSFSWNNWTCPDCDRETMTIVGEAINIVPIESNIIRRVLSIIENENPNCQITLIPYKQRRKYKKSVIRIYNPQKNLSIFVLAISNKKDIPFVDDLLTEGFGVVGIIDPEMSGKTDLLEGMGCNLINLQSVLNKIINNNASVIFSTQIEDQETKVLERIFSNLRTSVSRLSNKPSVYNEDLFEIDIKNLFQGIVPDVIRLGTEYKGQSVPDGYCCYGYRNTPLQRKKRLLGWDAKYSATSNYRLNSSDLKKQKKYIKWLCDKKSEPNKMGTLGIYAFISNFNSSNGFETTLTSLTEWDDFPRQCRLLLIEDLLIVKVCEWMLNHWQTVLSNNSQVSEVIFKWFRRKTSKPFNKLTIQSWPRLENKLNGLSL